MSIDPLAGAYKMSNSNEKQLANTNNTEQWLTVGNVQMDLSKLPEETRIQLLKEAYQGQIKATNKITELHNDNIALGGRLSGITSSINSVDNDTAVTITSVINDGMGQTEIIIGKNSEAAVKGKLSSQNRGEKDMTFWYVVIAAVVIVIVAISMR